MIIVMFGRVIRDCRVPQVRRVHLVSLVDQQRKYSEVLKVSRVREAWPENLEGSAQKDPQEMQ